jgi:outer membrane lipoprotein SlyB
MDTPNKPPIDPSLPPSRWSWRRQRRAPSLVAADFLPPADQVTGGMPAGRRPFDAPPPPRRWQGPQQGPAPLPEQQARQAPCSNCGVVESVRTIEHRPKGSGVGAVGGAVLGGLLGNQVGSGHGRLATVAGAVGGAVAGNQIEGNMKTTHSWDVVAAWTRPKRTFHNAQQPCGARVVRARERRCVGGLRRKVRIARGGPIINPTQPEEIIMHHRCRTAHPVAAGPGHFLHGGGFIHILLVVAIIAVLLRLISGRGV